MLAQVDAMDVQLGRVGEQLNGAQYELDLVQKRERLTARQLRQARKQYAVAEQRVVQRAVALYESNAPTTADAVLGASSVSSILDRLQVIQAAGALDHQIAVNAQTRRNQLSAAERTLTAERQRRAAAVAAIAIHRHTIAVELGQRRTLLASVQGEVHRLQAQEAARQARLAAAARARLAAQARERAREAVAVRAAAARAARARKTATKPAPTPAPTTTQAATTTEATTTAPETPPTTTDATTTTTTTAPPPTTTEQAPPPPPPPAGGHPEAASIAMRYLGVPYVFGGGTPAGFDCSGLVMYVFAQLGINLPHYAAAQYGFGSPVARSDLQPGDLVFFDALGHVGIYIGGNQFVHAPHTGDVVKINSISGWYASRYVGARRI